MQSTTSDIVRLRHCQIVSGSCQEVCKDARFLRLRVTPRGQTGEPRKCSDPSGIPNDFAHAGDVIASQPS